MNKMAQVAVPQWRFRAILERIRRCARPRRCRDDGEYRRDSRRGRRRRAWSARIANERPYAGRFGPHHRLATAGYPLRRAERMLADLAIGDRLVRKADGGRRPNVIRQIPGNLPADMENMSETQNRDSYDAVLFRVGFNCHAQCPHLWSFPPRHLSHSCRTGIRKVQTQDQ